MNNVSSILTILTKWFRSSTVERLSEEQGVPSPTLGETTIYALCRSRNTVAKRRLGQPDATLAEWLTRLPAKQHTLVRFQYVAPINNLASMAKWLTQEA